MTYYIWVKVTDSWDYYGMTSVLEFAEDYVKELKRKWKDAKYTTTV